MVKTVKTALKLFQDKEKWNKLVRQGMSLDFSWKVSAQKYMKLYKDVNSSRS
jgi:starch synthase